MQAVLLAQGAVPKLAGLRIGPFKGADGLVLVTGATLENERGFSFDTLVLPDGQAAVSALASDDHTMAFIPDQYRHSKTILALGVSGVLIDKAGLPQHLSDGREDPGLLKVTGKGVTTGIKAFIKAM